MEALDDDESIGGINIAPLVDVCLVLVLVFMVTMPFSALYGITVRDHKLTKYGLTVKQDHVQMHLTEAGIFIKDEKGADQKISYEDFGVVLRQMIQLSNSQNVMLQIDPGVPHGQTVWALDLAKQNGAQDISILEGE